MVDTNFSASNLITALNKKEEDIINGALTSWMNLPLPTLKGLAAEFMQNEDLAAAIEKCLTAPRAGQKDDLVCKWFYHWYQIDSQETRRFVLRYIPQLIWVYMYNIANNEAPPGVEACLLCIYNQEVAERADMEIIFHPPTLSLPSYLHKTSSDAPAAQPSANAGASAMLAPPAFTAPGLGPNPNNVAPPSSSLGQSSTLTENALRQFNKQVRSVTVEKALKPIDLVTNSNRNLVIRVALQKYNSNISLFSPRSWIAYCKTCKRLVNFGFDFTITPIPLLKSRSFAKKYIEEDLDNLVIDSDEELDDLDDFGDEISDSDGETKPPDVEKGENATDEDAQAKKKEKAKSPQSPGTPRRRLQKHLREASNSSTSSVASNASSSKIPPLSLPAPSSPSSAPATPPSSTNTPKDGGEGPSTTTTTTTTTQYNVNNNNNNHQNESNAHHTTVLGDPSTTPKNSQKPPVRISLAASVLQEMVTGLTFCIFKESYKEHALKAVRKIHLRACYDLMPEIILSANALLYLEFQERNKPAPQPGRTTPRGTSQAPV